MNKLISVLVLLAGSATIVHCGPSSTSHVNCSNWRNIVDHYGSRIFMVGDRGFHIPKDLHEMDTITCPRLIEASDRIKDVLKTCLKPFPRTVAGMIVRGTRKVARLNCNDPKEKADVVNHLRCVLGGNKIDKFHDIMDRFTKKLHVIRHSVPTDKKIDVTCCEYLREKDALEAATMQFCPTPSVRYAMDLVDRMMREAIEFVCFQYQQDSSKCVPVFKANPVNVTTESKKESLSFLLPLLDVLTAVGTPPDESSV